MRVYQSKRRQELKKRDEIERYKAKIKKGEEQLEKYVPLREYDDHGLSECSNDLREKCQYQLRDIELLEQKNNFKD